MAWFGGVCLFAAAILTTLEVFLRKFANFSFAGADEVSGFLFATATVFGLAFTMLHRTNVRIDALYIRLPYSVQIALDILGFLALGSFIGLIAWQGFIMWTISVEYDSVSITPLQARLAIPQGFWVAGLFFFMLVFTTLLLRVAQAVFQRDWTRVSALVGPRTLAEDITEETEQAQTTVAREHALMQDDKHATDRPPREQ